jgi:hypothetical protein
MVLRRRQLVVGAGAVGAHALLGGCAAPSETQSDANTELYVGLGRTREVAVLDAASDEVRARIALDALATPGRPGVPGMMGVGPTGAAAVLPLMSSGPAIGVISPASRRDDAEALPVVRARKGTRRCAAVTVGTGRSRGGRFGPTEAVQGLAADARGNAYILLGNVAGLEPSYAAIVDLARSATLRHLSLASIGESVFALAVLPDGERLFAAIWEWDPQRVGRYGATGQGRLVALETRTGRVVRQAALPADACVTDLALAPPSPGVTPASDPGALALYAVVATPGPSQDEDEWWLPRTAYSLVSLDSETLDPGPTWPLDTRPTALSVVPGAGGAPRAYFLTGWAGSVTRKLVAVDLGASGKVREWPMPYGSFGLAVSPVGKAYVADGFGDRLWRLDTSTDTLMSPVPLPGAPISVAARPF